MAFAILGSGFGVYGYLPALIRRGQTVLLPERYRVNIEQRDELGHLVPLVQWRKNDEAIRREATAIIISRRPADQLDWIGSHVSTVRAGSFILEKPLAPCPASAFRVIELIEASRKAYRIAYIFRFLPWASDLAAAAGTATGAGPIEIAWTFRAHHYLYVIHNWKRRVSEGGGALRFYGVHLIGLFAELGYREVTESHCRAASDDDCEAWSAVFKGPNLRDCRVTVDSNCQTSLFQIRTIGEGRVIANQPSPFSDASPDRGFDGRVAVLEKLCDTLIGETAPSHPWYARSVELWEMAERCSRQGRREGF